MQSGPSLLSPEERRFVQEMVRQCPNRTYLVDPKGIEMFNGWLLAYVQYRARLKFQEPVGPNPLPPGPTGAWIEWVFEESPRWIIGGLDGELLKHAQELASPSLNNLEALMSVYMQATTRSRVALSQVNQNMHSIIRQEDYDPFPGHLRVQLGETTQEIPKELEILLTELAQHTYNLLRVRVERVYDMDQPTRTEREKELKTWSSNKKVGQWQNTFLASNCRAEAQIGGNRTNAVNFIHYNQHDQNSLIRELELRKQDYERVPKMHGEIRLAEKLDDADEHSHIDIDKLCCVFCAAQLLAMDRNADVTGSTHGKLQWYTFTPYVMYFQHRRRLMWGEDIEQIFVELPLNCKLRFLKILAESCLGSAHVLDRDLPVVIHSLRYFLGRT